MTITRDTLKRLIPDIDAALAAVAAAHGVTLRCNGGTFEDSKGTIKLLVVPLAADGTPQDPARALLDSDGHFYGLSYGQQFTDSTGRPWTVAGLKQGRTGTRVVVTRPDGKRFLMTCPAVRGFLGTSAPAAQ